MAQVAGPQGPGQYLADAAASAFARTQSPGKHLAVHAPQLAVKPHLQILRRYCRPLLLCLEYADRPTLEDHVHCSARLGNRASLVVRLVLRLRLLISARKKHASLRVTGHSAGVGREARNGMALASIARLSSISPSAWRSST